MTQDEIIKGLVQLGKLMVALGRNEEWTGYETGVTKDEYISLQTTINREISHNGWFTQANVRRSLLGQGEWLTDEKLSAWTSNYPFTDSEIPVALIMAGNIPLVGFHDLLSVLLSGNVAICKLSSDDRHLLPMLIGQLVRFNPEFGERVIVSMGKLPEFKAVIATGSDNSLKYFEEYFGRYPHVFRKNRTSIAVLEGNETKEELESLGDDIFTYFGLGCRNVSHILIPRGFEFNRFFEGIYKHGDIINHHKYGNNYDYNKTVYLMNKHELLDNNFVLLRESEQLFSPLAMVHYQFYDSKEDVNSYIDQHSRDLQVIVGHGYTPFGKAQTPELTDYADGFDTMEWLSALSVK